MGDEILYFQYCKGTWMNEHFEVWMAEDDMFNMDLCVFQD